MKKVTYPQVDKGGIQEKGQEVRGLLEQTRDGFIPTHSIPPSTSLDSPTNATISGHSDIRLHKLNWPPRVDPSLEHKHYYRSA